jgi:N-acetylneuraminic acid mutarotase
MGGGYLFDGAGFAGAGCDDSCRRPVPLDDFWAFDLDSNIWEPLFETESFDQVPMWLEELYPLRDRCEDTGVGVANTTSSSKTAASTTLAPESEDEERGNSATTTAIGFIARPQARYGHSAIVVTDQMFLFGGTDGSQVFEDLWSYNVDNDIWRLLEPVFGQNPFSTAIPPVPLSFSALQLVIDDLVFIMGTQSPGYPPWARTMTEKVMFYNHKINEWRSSNYSGWVPAARSFSSLLSTNGYLYMFGGRGVEDVEPVVYADMWQFDPVAQFWEYQFIDSKDIPFARCQHLLLEFELGETFILFGGADKVSKLNDVWIYSIDKAQWEKVEVTGEGPPARSLCAGTIVNTGEIPGLLIFGGLDAKNRRDDMWLLDVASTQWKVVEPMTPAANRPAALGGFNFVSDKLTLTMIQGGKKVGSKVKDVGEMWQFSTQKNSWSRLTGDTSGPAGRHWHSVVEVSGEMIYLFGGNDGTQVLDDLWWYSRSLGVWRKEDFGLSKHPSKRYGAAAAPLCGIVFMYGGEVPGFPMSDLWVFMLSNDRLKCES